MAGPLVAELAAARALAPGLREQRATDRAWMLTGFELYFRATNGCGWSDDDYQDWLTELLQRQLLRDHPASTDQDSASGKRFTSERPDRT